MCKTGPGPTKVLAIPRHRHTVRPTEPMKVKNLTRFALIERLHDQHPHIVAKPLLLVVQAHSQCFVIAIICRHEFFVIDILTL